MQLFNQLSKLDQRAFLWCADSCSATSLIRFARIISRSGDGYLQVILPLTLFAYLGDEARVYIQLIATSFAIERTLYWLLKNSLKRDRPPVCIPSFTPFIRASDEFSFPSGHTSGAFMLALLTALYFPLLAIPLFVWAVMVGCSRVILGVHFPADIIAGACLGSFGAYYCQQALLLNLLFIY